MGREDPRAVVAVAVLLLLRQHGRQVRQRAGRQVPPRAPQRVGQLRHAARFPSQFPQFLFSCPLFDFPVDSHCKFRCDSRAVRNDSNGEIQHSHLRRSVRLRRLLLLLPLPRRRVSRGRCLRRCRLRFGHREGSTLPLRRPTTRSSGEPTESACTPGVRRVSRG